MNKYISPNLPNPSMYWSALACMVYAICTLGPMNIAEAKGLFNVNYLFLDEVESEADTSRGSQTETFDEDIWGFQIRGAAMPETLDDIGFNAGIGFTYTGAQWTPFNSGRIGNFEGQGAGVVVETVTLHDFSIIGILEFSPDLEGIDIYTQFYAGVGLGVVDLDGLATDEGFSYQYGVEVGIGFPVDGESGAIGINAGIMGYELNYETSQNPIPANITLSMMTPYVGMYVKF